MDEDSSLVSIIIPTYNRNDQLLDAVTSVFDQDYDPKEVIIVDDSGNAQAKSVVDLFDAVTYIPLDENKGAHTARQIGIEASNGRYIQFLDDDDRLLDQKLKKQVEKLESHPVGVVYCGLEWETGIKVLPDPRVRGSILENALMFRTSPCNIGTMLIEKEVLEEILPLKHLHGADDIGMQIELAQVTDFDYVDETLYFRGDSNSSRGMTQGAVDGRRQIIRLYDDLYDEFPPEIRRAAMAELYLVAGELELYQHHWSPAAITAFAKAAYLYPRPEVPYIGSFIASLFGRPVYRLARKFYSKYMLGNERRGKKF